MCHAWTREALESMTEPFVHENNEIMKKNKLCTIFFSRQFLQQISFVNKNPAQFLLTVVYCTQINYTLSCFGVIRPLWHWVNVWQVVSAVVGQCSALGFLSLQNNNHIRAGYFYFRLLFMGVCNILDIPASDAVYKCEFTSFSINTLSNIHTKQHCKWYLFYSVS